MNKLKQPKTDLSNQAETSPEQQQQAWKQAFRG
jgi:hypothetical protein